jgi:methylmalonyl-CoA/ethylmalonyl-CoA epimerase
MTVHAPVSPGLSEIGQIAIAVKDLPRALAFYRDVLGLPFLFEAPPNLAFFDCAGVRLMLSVPEYAVLHPDAKYQTPEFDRPAAIVYYKVLNLHETVAVLKSRGVTFESEPHLIAKMPTYDLWMAFLRDPDQNLLGLMSEAIRG